MQRCHAVGIEPHFTAYNDTVTEEKISAKIRELNEDENIDGIVLLVNLPAITCRSLYLDRFHHLHI
jgi:methylenetetrahydrofolate dehydrogenase (NADP+)/methenyltetrahydrofolate cyclohydrolase